MSDSSDRHLSFLNFGGSRRIYAGEERFSAPKKQRLDRGALALGLDRQSTSGRDDSTYKDPLRPRTNLPRQNPQPMHANPLLSPSTKRRRNPPPSKPLIKLIAIVRTSILPRLSSGNLHKRKIPIRKISHKSHSRPMLIAHSPHRIQRTTLLQRPNTKNPPQKS